MNHMKKKIILKENISHTIRSQKFVLELDT